MKKKNKKPFTLIEIMIVVFLIGIIGGVIGYNMKGSINEGRAFKSERGSKQIYDLLTLKMSDGTKIDAILANPKLALEQNGFVNNVKKLMQDGWGKEFELKKLKSGDFIVYSEKWYQFLRGKKGMTEESMQEEYPWAFYFEYET